MHTFKLLPLPLLTFIEEVTEIVDTHTSPDAIVTNVESLVKVLVQQDEWLDIDIQDPLSRVYSRHSLYRDPLNRFEVLALVWPPGVSTSLHDHDGTWGIEGVLSGTIQVDNFVKVRTLPNGCVKLRHTDTMRLGSASTGQLLPPADCHIITTIGNSQSITIHVYGKQLKQFTVFIPTNNTEVFMPVVTTIR